MSSNNRIFLKRFIDRDQVQVLFHYNNNNEYSSINVAWRRVIYKLKINENISPISQYITYNIVNLLFFLYHGKY
jgi:hypothetical protein